MLGRQYIYQHSFLFAWHVEIDIGIVGKSNQYYEGKIPLLSGKRLVPCLRF